MKEKFFTLRRLILKCLIPEFIWPKVILLDEVPIRVRNMKYSFGVKRILVDGSYESPERQLLSKIAVDGFNVIEMGSSIGILTQILASKIGSEGKVVGIEADHIIATQTSNDLSDKKNIKILSGYGFPVMSINRLLKIKGFDSTLGSLGGMVEFEIDNSIGELENDSIYDIEKIITLTKIRPDLLVVDIEGAEQVILSEKLNYPLSIKYILIELHPGLYTQITKNDIVNRIIENGFSLKNKISNSYLFERV